MLENARGSASKFRGLANGALQLNRHEDAVRIFNVSCERPALFETKLRVKAMSRNESRH